jgi:hypothetical protein
VQYRSTCAFCRGYLDILHPIDDHEFVCGNGNAKDWMIQEFFRIRFNRRRYPADAKSQEKEGTMDLRSFLTW